jgi:N-acetyl-anhydromuramyl-L-alanine amidase AmpD
VEGYTQLNNTSIGIEIVNAASTIRWSRRWPEFPKAQMDVVIALVKDIVARHGVGPDFVVGHSDIAPQRKMDPGPKFPWKRLADEGLIRWPTRPKWPGASARSRAASRRRVVPADARGTASRCPERRARRADGPVITASR